MNSIAAGDRQCAAGGGCCIGYSCSPHACSCIILAPAGQSEHDLHCCCSLFCIGCWMKQRCSGLNRLLSSSSSSQSRCHRTRARLLFNVNYGIFEMRVGKKLTRSIKFVGVVHEKKLLYPNSFVFQRQTATTTPQSQQAAAISAALAAGSRPAAATPPAMQQQQLQTSRKRPLEVSAPFA